MTAPGPDELLTRLLKEVSRSFYRTLRILPGTIRKQISLAYLLARTTDTIADTELVPLEKRLEALLALRERIAGRRATPVEFAELARHQGAVAERTLLDQSEASLGLLQTLTADDRHRVQQVLDIIAGGQELDLRRFAGAPAGGVIALRTDDELDDYTYRVAGCVGEFWTRMCRAHLFPQARLDESWLLTNGVRFGKGLQLVNILRDLPADLARGRCYLPETALAAAGLQPQALLGTGSAQQFRPLYTNYLDRAEAHLRSGWDYTLALPWRQARVRLACSWPILIGLKTLRLLRTANILDRQQRVKVSRGEIKKIFARSILLYPWPRLWSRLPPR